MVKRHETKNIKRYTYLIYLVVAVVCVLMVRQAWVQHGLIIEKRDSIESNRAMLGLSGEFVASVREAQQAANLYISTHDTTYLTNFDAQVSLTGHKLDSLVAITSDTVFSSRYCEIGDLLSRRKQTILSLEQLFRFALPARKPVVAAPADTPVEAVTTRRDSVIVTPKNAPKKSLLKRIGEVFVPDRDEASQTVTTSTAQKVETLPPAARSAAASAQVDMASLGRQYNDRLEYIEHRVVELVNYDWELSNRISEIIFTLHYISLEEVISQIHQAEHYIESSSRQALWSGIAALILALVLVILIIADVNRGHRLRLALERSKERVERLMESKHRLLLTISHDIKTPLSSILGYLEIWQGNKMTEEQRTELDSMHSSCEYILSLLANLLEHSSLEQGKMVVNPCDFDVRDLGRELSEMFTPAAMKKGLSFRYDEQLDFDHVSSDFLKIKQIAANLISNAVKYTTDGYVGFNVQTSGEELTLRVGDSGIGIPEENIDELFEPFTRMSNVDTAAQDGVGFGLSVVKRLTDLLGGTISVVSRVGEGSEFTVTLPVQRAWSGGQPTAEETLPEMRILAIDDDATLLEMLRKLIGRMGHGIVTCENPELLTKCLEERFDIVVVDMEIGPVSGRDLVATIRERNPGAKVIVMTGLSEYGLDQAKREGFDHLILKPFSTRSLSRAFAVAMGVAVNGEKSAECAPDMNSLELYFGGDEDVIRESIPLFRDGAASHIPDLERAIGEGDFAAAAAVCHKLLPMLIQFGGEAIAPVPRRINRERDEAKYPDWRTDLSAFLKKYREFAGNVDKLFA